MGIILAPISLLLFIVVFIIETVFSLFFETKNRKWFQLISKRMYEKAKLIDIFGNYLFPEFWNFVFSKKKKDKSLTYFGLFIYYSLYLIDFPSWKYKGHCIRYIMTEEQIKNFK